MKFVSVPQKVYRVVSLKAAAVYGTLRFHAMNKEICWPSTATLAVITGLSRETVALAIKELVEAGLVLAERRFKRSNIYTVKPVKDDSYLRIPLDLLEKQCLCWISSWRQAYSTNAIITKDKLLHGRSVWPRISSAAVRLS